VIGAGVTIGANVVIHAGTVLEDRATVQDGVVLGKVATLAPHSRAPSQPPGPLVVGSGATVCTGAVVFAGASIGPGVIVGDQAHVRELTSIAADSVIGRGSALGARVSLGRRVRVQTNVWLTSWTIAEDDVFVGPGVVTMNDKSMARLADSESLHAPTLRRACRLGGGALITPGIEVGEEAYVAAGAVVTQAVPPHAFVAGIPARVRRQVPDEELIEQWR
jgi:UDP-2-acetamido-3-amino-2,3-dideoxy-glucuronate N-acetyltransferase